MHHLSRIAYHIPALQNLIPDAITKMTSGMHSYQTTIKTNSVRYTARQAYCDVLIGL